MNNINIDILNDNLNFANTYFLYNNERVIIIDPACDIRNINKFVGNKKVLAVLLTHGHYDHFKTLEEVINKYQIKCYLHKNAKDKIFNLETSYANMFGCYKLPNIKEETFRYLSDGETINLDNINIKVMFTPGHTNCSVMYLVDNMMISGDTLFKLSVGRTDLATGNKVVQMNTLNKLLKIKEDYIVYPGHEEQTTLLYEQKYNPYFK